MKFTLVCGASGDIGSQIVTDLAEAGWSLYLQYNHNESVIEHLVAQLTDAFPKQEFFMIQADFHDAQSISKIESSIFALDAVIFAQGSTQYKLFSELKDDELENLWLEHVKVPLLLSRDLTPKLAMKDSGRIIFVGSVYGAVGSSMEVAYSMLKGALSSFANAYAKEVATEGITVNVIAPGAVKTQMNDGWSSESIKRVNDEIPVSRWATPRDISFMVGNLLDSRAGYVTGQTIYVDGGWLK